MLMKAIENAKLNHRNGITAMAHYGGKEKKITA